MVTNESMRIERFRSNSTGTVEENLTRPRVRINLVITAIQYRVVLIKQSPTVASNRNNVSISFVVFSVSATLLVAFRRPPFPTFNPTFAFPQFTRHIRMTISTSPDGFFLLVRNTTLCHHTRLELFTRAPCRSSNDRPPDLLADEYVWNRLVFVSGPTAEYAPGRRDADRRRLDRDPRNARSGGP